ncbi:MaoC family dehydratase [Pseudonocardia pini]|uniref:MaoC family dehydratase n=1 Tax=Pseudonocardia pini TaxID=2758030 RepID=UPI0015F0FD8D|nr:MaoC/PaaZ C-terminal domain-containing protein [Pseudonocardia pini]
MSEQTFNRLRHTFDDFAVGDSVVTAGRTVDIGDITAFAGLTGDHYPLHTDEEFARSTQFGGRIAHGPLTYGFAVGLVGLSGFLGDAIVAFVETQNLRALAPVRPGDTLRVRAEVVEAVPGHKPHYGTVHIDYSVLNQKDEEVMRFRFVLRARRIPEGDQGE